MGERATFILRPFSCVTPAPCFMSRMISKFAAAPLTRIMPIRCVHAPAPHLLSFEMLLRRDIEQMSICDDECHIIFTAKAGYFYLGHYHGAMPGRRHMHASLSRHEISFRYIYDIESNYYGRVLPLRWKKAIPRKMPDAKNFTRDDILGISRYSVIKSFR